jgi:hypothetical protein
MHLSSHWVKPSRQVHTPPSQVVPATQALSQLPQLAALLCKSTQPDAQGVREGGQLLDAESMPPVPAAAPAAAPPLAAPPVPVSEAPLAPPVPGADCWPESPHPARTTAARTTSAACPKSLPGSCRPSSEGQRACRDPAGAVFCSQTLLLIGPGTRCKLPSSRSSSAISERTSTIVSAGYP